MYIRDSFYTFRCEGNAGENHHSAPRETNAAARPTALFPFNGRSKAHRASGSPSHHPFPFPPPQCGDSRSWTCEGGQRPNPVPSVARPCRSRRLSGRPTRRYGGSRSWPCVGASRGLGCRLGCPERARDRLRTWSTGRAALVRAPTGCGWGCGSWWRDRRTFWSVCTLVKGWRLPFYTGPIASFLA
ncbi:hypothetical protein BC938DRAFT_482131 [Jimgerdemannia flammicorona]|uniref:Uncharacterized protein n=1 Tax=Jimgerdemannia flammicorona TaxID=994334 RepID=A0A433QEJ9_9FUNG|nr:hypothetical protein BC938DRAFT_482131 [Jimgerdemannia flammicorona]